MFKFKIAKLEDVAEELRKYYSQGADGAFYLTVEGAVDRARLDEFRNNNIDLQKKLERFKDIDPDKVAEILENERKIAEKKLIDAGDIEGLVNSRIAAMKQDYETRLGNTSKSLETANRQLETLLIDNEVRAHAIKIGVAPTAVDDVLLRAKTVFKVEEGRPVAKNEKGEVLYGKDGQNPLAVGDWIGGLKEVAPHLFQPSQGSGSTNAQRGGPSGQKLSAAQKISQGLRDGTSSAIQ